MNVFLFTFEMKTELDKEKVKSFGEETETGYIQYAIHRTYFVILKDGIEPDKMFDLH